MALTCTPRTSTRGTTLANESCSRIADPLGRERGGHLRLDPLVGAGDALLERHLRLPSEHLAEPVVVGIASANALRPGHVAPGHRYAGHFRHHVRELVDADETVLPEVDRIAIGGLHQAFEARDAVVDVAERPRLLAVSPDLDLVHARQLRDGHLAAHRGRRLLAPAAPRPERAEDVVEPYDAGVETVVISVVEAETLGHQLLQPVGDLRLRR